MRVARALQDLPLIAAAFEAGELSYSKVRAITRVAVPDDQHEWIGIAAESTGAGLDRIVATVRSALDRDENRDARRAFERRKATHSTREDGLGQIRLIGPQDAIDTIWAAIDTETSRLIDNASGDGTTKRRELIDERGGLAAMRFDAVVELTERTLAANPTAAIRGDIGRLQLVIDTDFLADLTNQADTVDGECTLGGRRIAPEVARRWACDTRASVLLEHDGHCHDEGRDHRTPNRRLRRALHRRDHGMCRFPGCGTTTWLHAHHIHHWTKHGPTDLANLLSVCGYHHRLIHEGGWNVSLIDNTVVWTDPDGIPTTIEPLKGDPEPINKIDVPAGTIESRWHNDRLDFAFVTAVIAHHATTIRKRPRRDVSAGT